jgi:AraC-like DNA-binding protein
MGQPRPATPGNDVRRSLDRRHANCPPVRPDNSSDRISLIRDDRCRHASQQRDAVEGLSAEKAPHARLERPRLVALGQRSAQPLGSLLHGAAALGEGKSVTEAGLEAGYSSTSAFIAAFRKHFGVTPSRLG